MAPSVETVSFCFNKFGRGQQNLHLQDDALITSSGYIQLTKVSGGEPIDHSVGRALYSAPIHIWDRNTGHVANFNTAFSFVINAENAAKTADGLAFFLAPVGTQAPHHKRGGLLGLFPNDRQNETTQIVAVEFDTYKNEWDSDGPHIGIDVNSIVSKNFTPWDFANGEVANVTIGYEASSKKLTASLVHPSVSATSYKQVEAHVDLKGVLPEYVCVGFAAATGALFATHDVLSWSFNSVLP